MEVATGALSSLLPKLAALLIGEYKLQKEVKGGIIFLQAELESMKAALDEISTTPPDKLNKPDKIWAREVRELSYDIEDKIDAFMVRCKVAEAEHGFNKAINGILNRLGQPKVRRKIATDIRDIKSRLLEVHERHRRYEVNIHSDGKHTKLDPRALVRYEDVAKLVGIDEARDEVIKILIEGNEVSKQQDKIVSIVGFGGLGKTTLANVVYEKVKQQFNCSAFVSVSQTPDMDKLFKDMFFQLAKYNSTSINVIDELRELLQQKRYLIVIDDIWDISIWESIRCALPVNNSGCIIVTTTRIQNVAEKIGGAYKMKPLCLRNSRMLLHRRIFGHEGKEQCPDEELAKISDRILTKCAGVPLAIITIASLLANKRRDKLDWYEVYNSIGTGMGNNNMDVENMRKVLSLSFYNLPSYLRACLLYLSVFPEDFKINKSCLIWMWIAEGFIQSEKQGQSLFEVGESYFNELINRSLIQPVYDLYCMKIHSCCIHDMVLDLICSLSSEENFITTPNYMGHHPSPSQKIRRLSLQNGRVNEGMDGASTSMHQVRSLAAFSSAVNLIPALSRFEVVRVLHLENCDLSHGYGLNYIGKLVHLRFLGLRSTKIVHLPEEIGSLQFLQVLDISKNAMSTLPFTIVQLRQLKCLYIDQKVRLENRIGGLTSLEELRFLDSYKDSNGIIQELGCLTKLRVLDIVDCTAEENMLVECLQKLQNIQDLSIRIKKTTNKLDGWVGHQSLRSLGIYGYMYRRLPVWIKQSHVRNLSLLKITVWELQQQDLETLGRLPALRDLDLSFYETCSHACYWEFVISAGLFPFLLHFRLEGYSARVVFQQGAMPRLRNLALEVPFAVWSEWTENPDLGFENLLSLLHLRVALSGGWRDVLTANVALAALRNMAEFHPNHPSLDAPDYRHRR